MEGLNTAPGENRPRGVHNKIIIIILANEQRGRTTQTFTHARTPRQTGRGGGEGRRGGGEEGRRGGGEEGRRGGGEEGRRGGGEFEASDQRALAGRLAEVPYGHPQYLTCWSV